MITAQEMCADQTERGRGRSSTVEYGVTEGSRLG